MKKLKHKERERDKDREIRRERWIPIQRDRKYREKNEGRDTDKHRDLEDRKREIESG